jgi:serine protease
VSYPAAYPGAIAVAATQYDRSTTFYSNWGPEIDLAAPGGNTRIDQNGDGMPDGVLQNTIGIGRPLENDYLLFMGTSMASPHVAGVAALVVGQGVTQPGAVLKLLKRTARHPGNKSWDEHHGAGIVDAGAAVAKVGAGWGGYKAGLATVLGLLLLGRLRQQGRLALRPGAGALLGLTVGACGLFFLPALDLHPGGALGTLLTQGFPSWDLALLGAAGHANPLFFSLLGPLVLAALLFGARRLRGVLFGFAVGVAAHLLFQLLFVSADVAWIPNLLALDALWLLGNALGCLGLASVLARE